ncbi:glycosyltransferase family 2 protein [Variovorax sp. NFACC27]|uniref:glycosyltransferase family 2 protein n=1 Tax=unclassified Variovorax TaxID=663243 RepID=UPI000896C25C|nr:N-terminal domain of galactosyltransferase [Variovorax sp. NFACC28]SEG90458.1 N-terminal domain of galactosyltransferase [Variovorax sp. NFACC29]SFD35549.1 N-terminal domain of galactosyltransferase [Variovorax sp. NFACC26]SFG39168.1 N-terminal domain of galactosyltransferase [Variovorax sp. NFACC27]
MAEEAAEKISLRDVDIIVSYREATEERRENLYAVLAHLACTYTDYRLWLMEAAPVPRFDWQRLGDPRIRHVFIHHEGPFPKSMLYNAGVRLARSPVICFHDADSIAQPQALRICVDGLLDGDGSDAMCPYWNVINVTGELKQGFMDTPDFGRLAAIDPQQLPPDAGILYSNANGGIVLFKRSEYIRVGGYNARLEGWGGEDDELLRRAGRMGVRWHSLAVPMFHLHHDSGSRTELIESIRDTENLRAPQAIEGMSQEEVEALVRELSAFFN